MSHEASDFFVEENVTQQQIDQYAPDSDQEASEQPVYDDPDTSMFAGDAAVSVPSAQSTYHRKVRSRAQLSRKSMDHHRPSVSSRRRRRSSDASRTSKKSSRPNLTSRPSVVSNAVDSESEEDEEETGRKSGTFSGLTAMFRRRSTHTKRAKEDDETSMASSRRSSMYSTRSKASTAANLRGRRTSVVESVAASIVSGSEEEDEEGEAAVYGSSVSTSSTRTTDSQGSNHEEERPSIPGGLFITHGFVGGADPFFGDHRVDMGSPGSEKSESQALGSGVKYFDSLGGEMTGARQPVYIPDEDLQIVLLGWGPKTWKVILWYLCCFLSVGLLPLLGKWFPNLWLQGKGKVREFSRASSVVAHVSIHNR